jgi:hypothetical protein
VVTNPISWRVDVLGPARQVRAMACRLIAQLADRIRISAGGPAVCRLSGGERQKLTSAPVLAASSFGRESIPLPKPRQSTAISEVMRGGERTPEHIDLQVLLTTTVDFAHNSGR